MRYSTYESEYLVQVLTSAIKGEAVSQPESRIDWSAFVELAKKQQVFSIIAPALEGVDMPKEQAEELSLYNKNELLRTLAMKSEQERLESLLEEKGIHFMLLKGSMIRKYYPLYRMRQMSDVDVLYDSSKRKELFTLMADEGYSVMSCSENSDDFTKKPFYTFEFHRELFFKEHDFYCDFSNVWNNATVSDDNSCKYIMSKEDLYLHSIAHMNKHYRFGGFGVRFLVDTYLIIKSDWDSFDKAYIHSRLEEMKLTDFEQFIRVLSLGIFDGKRFNDEQIAFLNNSLKFGIYGNDEGIKIYYEEYRAKVGSRATALGFFCSKLFPPKSHMKRVYPVLEKHGYLLPVLYIYRLFNKLVFSRKTTLKNYKVLRKYLKEND